MPGRLLDAYQKSFVKPGKMTEPGQWQEVGQGITANGDIPKSVQCSATGASQDSKTVINGIPGLSQPVTLPQDLQESMKQLPPEIAHIVDGYSPLSLLFERAAQETFSNLSDLVNRLHSANYQGQSNGDGGHSGQQTSEGIDKRRQWLEFAQKNRERFLKLFVLLQWGRATREPIGRLVDVMDWMRKRQALDETALEGIGLLKKELFDVQMPNPDLERALEILTTAKSSRIPDFGFLPKAPLSPKQLLDHFNNVNILLHVRLNVHENLPKLLQQYSIGSGRVTFTIPNEFEMDLSILDEDPTSRFYLIDFRFLFSPCSEVPNGQLRVELEIRAGSILASEGLLGCYEFLHDFVLTQKLSILRRQAVELARDSWCEHLRVDRIHRTLILQYWVGRPGKKNWVEIGISSGKDIVTEAPQEPKQSKLSVKWMRHGKQVLQKNSIRLDETILDVECLLEQVVGKHVEHILRTAATRLKTIVPLAVGPMVRINTSLDGDYDCSLTIPLLSADIATLRIEATTGSFAISPASDTAKRREEVLNAIKDPIEDLAQELVQWRLDYAIGSIRAAVPRFGWYLDSSRITLDSAIRTRFFGDPKAKPILIRRWPQSGWVVAACYDGCFSFHTWLLEVRSPKQRLYESEGLEIVASRRLHVDGALLSASFFHKLAVVTEETIQAVTLYGRLNELHLPFSIIARDDKLSKSPRHIGIDVRKLHLHRSMSSTVALSFRLAQGAPLKSDQNEGTVLHVAKAFISPSPCVSALVSSVKADDINVTPSGAISILQQSILSSPNAVDQIIRRIRRISDILTYLEVLHDLRLKVQLVSFDSITFGYARLPQELYANISWVDASETATLKFEPSSNPHKRLLPVLRSVLSSQKLSTESPLAILPPTLLITLPLFRAFDDIEVMNQDRPQIHIINAESYTMIYPKPRAVLDIQYRRRIEADWWYITSEKQTSRHNTNTSGQPNPNDRLQQSLRGFFHQPNTENVKGLRIGVAANLRSIYDVIRDLDKVIRSCANDEPVRRNSQAGQQDALANGNTLSQPDHQQNAEANGAGRQSISQSQPSHALQSSVQSMSRNPSLQPSPLPKAVQSGSKPNTHQFPAQPQNSQAPKIPAQAPANDLSTQPPNRPSSTDEHTRQLSAMVEQARQRAGNPQQQQVPPQGVGRAQTTAQAKGPGPGGMAPQQGQGQGQGRGQKNQMQQGTSQGQSNGHGQVPNGSRLGANARGPQGSPEVIQLD